MPADFKMESITFRYVIGDQRYDLTLRPRRGKNVECGEYGRHGIGSIIFSADEMARIQEVLPRNERSSGDYEVPDPGPDFPFEHSYEHMGPVDPNVPAWRITATCVHCAGCGYQCISTRSP